MKKALGLLVVLVWVASQLNAQTDSSKQKILIIPFNPAMYFSDADEDIAKGSKVKREQVKDIFRGSLDRAISDKFLIYFEPIRFSRQNSGVDYVPEHEIYNSLVYVPEQKENPRYNKSSGGRALDKLKSKFSKEESSSHELEQPFFNYMGVQLRDTSLLNFLERKYKAKVFVFINQFEVETNYSKCLDLANKNYRRNIRVHYTVIDSSGNNIAGNVIEVKYYSNENDIKKIVTHNFSDIADEIILALP